MATRREILLKWGCYGAAALVLLFLNHLLLGQVQLWGVAAFLPPLLVALPASFEEAWPSSLFGLLFGILCDLALTAPIPCLYTLAFTLSAVAAAMIAKYAIQPGFFCSFAATVTTFFIVHLFTAAAFFFRGGASLAAIVSRGLRETAVSCLLLAVCYPLFRTLRRVFDY